MLSHPAHWSADEKVISDRHRLYLDLVAALSPPRGEQMAQKRSQNMTAPKTGAERVADHNARLRDQGLRQVRSLWAHPEDHKAIRAYVARLTNRRRMVGKA